MKKLKIAEEKKRDAHWDPVIKWKILQETIAWADAQSTVQRNHPANRLAEQTRKRSLSKTHS